MGATAMKYIVMCQVSGGVTGFRQATLKKDGVQVEFDTLEEAATRARELSQQMNGNPYRTADYKYWAETLK